MRTCVSALINLLCSIWKKAWMVKWPLVTSLIVKVECEQPLLGPIKSIVLTKLKNNKLVQLLINHINVSYRVSHQYRINV